MIKTLENFARQGEIVVMAGAGVSVGKPSALPGWKATNAAIVQVLSRHLETAIAKPDWLSSVMPAIDAERQADRFPPDYQAQLIEEMCGERYFQALQSLDVDAINASHDSIAALAAAGAIKAVVTTNFDRLIEQALDKRAVEYVVACDDVGYADLHQALTAQNHRGLPVLKIHGCVSDHRSMIDTLKQRQRGRSQHLQACLDILQSGYWVYLGFSAADLETDPNYLGLVAGATNSAGATYVAYPDNPNLGRGATTLMNAYGDRAQVVQAYVAAYLGEVCQALGMPGPDEIPDAVALGPAQFQEKLEAWAAGLSAAATGLCLAAILEAIGQAEPAVRILDRLVRKELHDQRDTADFHALQLHYGRLGAAWGRFVAVPDLVGAASNASVETAQSLLRLLDSQLGFAAAASLACLWLWLGEGQRATSLAVNLLGGFLNGQWEGTQPQSDEEAVDAWLSAAQVCIFNAHTQTISLVASTAGTAFAYARRSGDVVRTARVAALQGLAIAETPDDVPALLAEYEAHFEAAARVGDGFALGMRALALGRWHVGPGGLAIASATDSETVAQKALIWLAEAIEYFHNQGMDPWISFAQVQRAKAYADLHQFDDVQVCINRAEEGADRFPILMSHVYEVTGQVHAMRGNPAAAESFQAALEAAEASGLLARHETLLQYVSQAE